MKKTLIVFGILVYGLLFWALALPFARGVTQAAKKIGYFGASLKIVEKNAHRNEKRQLWKQIAWRKDFDTAMAEAKRLNKPVLAVFYVNEFGRKDAEHC